MAKIEKIDNDDVDTDVVLLRAGGNISDTTNLGKTDPL